MINKLKKIRESFPSKYTVSYRVESGAGYGRSSAYSRSYVDEWLDKIDALIEEYDTSKQTINDHKYGGKEVE